jgi:serine/threonine protein kinase
MAQAGFVHLDVKPDNIVMGVPPRLIDLSIARDLRRAAETVGPIGTDAYMAPEQCGPSEAPIGPATDAWGLGATLFHAASGEKPFPRGSGQVGPERFPQLREGPRDLPGRLPESLRTLILGLLDPDPGRRPGCDEVVSRLEPLIAEMPSRLRLSRRGAAGI